MTFLPLDRPAATWTTPFAALWSALKALLPQGAPIDGAAAARQNALRAEARANVDRLLR